MKWNRRIEPVRYAEAKAAFITATEEVTMRAITYYFNLLLAEENLGTARQNLSNADHLYKVALAKREMGQISENELLQLKLSALNAKASLTEAESDLNAKMFQLRAFLGVGEDENLRPVIPETVDGTKMEYNQRRISGNPGRNENAEHPFWRKKSFSDDRIQACSIDGIRCEDWR